MVSSVKVYAIMKEKNKNGEKVDRKSKNGRRKRIKQLDRVKRFLATFATTLAKVSADLI